MRRQAERKTINHPLPGRRINVVGNTAAGKTHMAAALAELLGLARVELDALYWGPDWTPSTVQAMRAQVEAATRGDGWVVDGNYSMVRDIVWARADTLVWLDLRLSVVMWRVLRRTLGRMASGEVLWNGNREGWRQGLASRDSIILWALTTHRRRQREFGRLLATGNWPRLTVIHLRTPAEAAAWLARVRADRRP
jgi:adenylate kinase family enzyme